MPKHVVKLNPTPEDRELITKIADRYAGYMKREHNLKVRRPDLDMDIAATHLNGCPLNLQKLHDFDDFNMVHDITGIVRHLDRSTGKLGGFFDPRCGLSAAEIVTERLTK